MPEVSKSITVKQLADELALDEKETAYLSDVLQKYLSKIGQPLDQISDKNAARLINDCLNSGSPCRGLEIWPVGMRTLNYHRDKEAIQQKVTLMLLKKAQYRRKNSYSLATTPGRSSSTNNTIAGASTADTQAGELDEGTKAKIDAANARAEAEDKEFDPRKKPGTHRKKTKNIPVNRSPELSTATRGEPEERMRPAPLLASQKIMKRFTDSSSGKTGSGKQDQPLQPSGNPQSIGSNDTVTVDGNPPPQTPKQAVKGKANDNRFPPTPETTSKGKRKATIFDDDDNNDDDDWENRLPDAVEIFSPHTTERARAGSIRDLPPIDASSPAKAPRLTPQAGSTPPAESAGPSYPLPSRNVSQPASTTSAVTTNPIPASQSPSPISPSPHISNAPAQPPTFIRAGLNLYTPSNLSKLPDLLLDHVRDCEQVYKKEAEKAGDNEERRAGFSATANLLQDLLIDLNTRARSLAHDVRPGYEVTDRVLAEKE